MKSFQTTGVQLCCKNFIHECAKTRKAKFDPNSFVSGNMAKKLGKSTQLFRPLLFENTTVL